MFKWFCELFKTLIPEEDYERGYAFAKKHLADGGTTEYLESCIDGAKLAGMWMQFDSGIQAVLDEQRTEVRHD